MHILFAGGGTAGHINPALAVAGYIKEKHPDAKISYIGTERGLESRLVREAGYDFYTIEVAGFQRQISLSNIKKNFSAVIKMFTSSKAAKKLLKELKPDVVVGTGGYVSGPVLREAAKLNIKCCIHEQNAYPGVTNKALSSMVDEVMLAFPEAEKHLRCKNKPIVTGNPVRMSVLSANREEARKKLGVGNSPVILSFGGSLGARPINKAVVGLIKWHAEKDEIFHIHGTGKSGYSDMLEDIKAEGINLEKHPKITVREYINDMDVCLAAADLVICRSGAITLSELQNCGKAAILIPSPYVAENHQFHNAMSLKSAGAAEIIEEKDLNGDTLAKMVSDIIGDASTLEQMSINAKKSAISDSNEKIYDVIMKLL
ncbi:MAG: undecaprenyldiphospho-muramoylpentapeptide beta-N-acetylglucosaminyltransferase [Clostridia bacterium]|nr:undecaprenyldiphospho-muramoylpentapeptide beta-N-acetylglucosaminyltransferase [Clostridia bacterium]